MIGLNTSVLLDGVAVLSLMVVKPAAILALVLFSHHYLRKLSASAQHFCLAIGLHSLLLLPVAVALLPPLEWEVLPPAVAMDSIGKPFSVDTPLPDTGSHSLSPLFWWVTGIYLLGVFWILFYLAIGVWQVRRQAGRGRACDETGYRERHCLALVRELGLKLGIHRPVAMKICSGLPAPQVWGLWKPTIMVPAGFTLWPRERQRRVLIHELSHVRRFDWPMLLLSRLVCALFWFLPLTWLVAKRMQIMAELACDDQVVTLEGQGVAYAEDLLTIVRGRPDAPIHHTIHHNSDVVLSVVSGSPIYLRVRALLDSARDRTRMSLRRKTLALLMGSMLILPLSSLQATVIRESVVYYIENAVVRWLPLTTVALPRESATGREPTTAAAPLSAAKLAQLKSQLTAGSVPPGDIEEVIVVAREFEPLWEPGENSAGAAGLQQLELEPRVYIQGYMPLVTVTPEYPSRAQRRGIEGRVIVQFTISPQGRVEQPRIQVSQPSRVFDNAVLAALQQFRFKPQVMGGEPVAITGVTESFIFRLTDDEAPPPPRRRSPFPGSTQVARHF